MHSLKVLFALTAAAALTACGGGGGGGGGADDGSAAPVSPPPTPAVGTNGSLQTRVTAANYSADSTSRRLDAFNQLNTARRGAGAGLLAQSNALDMSAQDHADYLSANGFDSADSVHDETLHLPGFTGVNPFVRMQAQGYDYSYATEVIGDIGSTSPASDCVGDLLDTVYHAASMLSRVTDVGFGYGTAIASQGMCTIDMASPLNGGGDRQIPPSGAIVAYPYGGSTVAHGTFHVSNESPRVSTSLLPKATAGTPIVIGFRNQDVVAGGAVTITQFSMATASGADVPGVILGAVAQEGSAAVTGPGVNPDSALDTDFAVFVPTSPLPAGTYSVTLRATISGGQALALTNWSFVVAAL